ncbi:MAG: ABC transporter ATP-binding protein [Treponemataceae bacterium]|nr:ABC transporter ATP-binding protein [Treponemataceae bacterium]
MFVEITDIYQKFDDLAITFSGSVDAGQMLVITGHSGSGKSTVLRMIAGLLDESKKAGHAGTICIGGTDVSELAPGKRGIGMAFQSPSLFMHMNVEDNVAYGLRSRGMSRKEARLKAHDMLERMGLSADIFARRMPANLSGGEQQRVSLARTLVIEPKLVLFDEPFSALDAPLRKKLGAELRSQQKDLGFAGIMVTHDLDEAVLLADQITVMNHGEQTWTGLPADFSEDRLSH